MKNSRKSNLPSMKIHSNSFTKTFLRSSPQYYHAEKRTTVSWTIWLRFEKAEMLYDTFISIAANSRYAIPVNLVALKHAEWNKGRRVQKGTFLNRHSTNFPTTRGTFQSSPRPSAISEGQTMESIVESSSVISSPPSTF